MQFLQLWLKLRGLMKRKWQSLSFGQKLILFTTSLLFVACLIIGISGYVVSRNAMIDKGKVILKNGVKSAIMLIDDMNKGVERGEITLEEAQEAIKIYLMGPLREDGTRQNNNALDFGENGYYIIYSQQGIEIMHPTLEGEDVWLYKDKSNSRRDVFIVQDTVKTALSGGGFTEYTWEYPYSNKLGHKIVYSELDPNWGWVVTAGSYISDFDKAAMTIIQITITTLSLITITGYMLANRFIFNLTKPLIQVVEAMKHAETGALNTVPDYQSKDELGTLIRGFNTMIDSIVTAQSNLIKKDDQLLQYAYYDTLSLLPNAYFLKVSLSARLESLTSESSFLLIDIKDFNVINSIYGSSYGDKLIEAIGKEIIDSQLEDAIVARIGGNEFAVWLGLGSEEHVEERIVRYVDQLKAKLKTLNYVNQLEFYLSFVAISLEDNDYDMIYQKASIALQYAKNHKITQIVKYRPEMYHNLERESKIMLLAERALSNDDFTVHYQCKVDVKVGRVYGVESLARWHVPEIGNISPDEFIPLLYKANLMTAFSQMIVIKSLDDMPKLQSLYGDSVSVSINISPIMFFNDDFVAFMDENIKKRAINPSTVILEITEDVFISDFNLVQNRINEIRRLGMKISLDDFGTGYSSLNYLSKIKFDEIKIDKSFIDNIVADATAYSLFMSIVRIANALDCEVVAEGVETQFQVNLIREGGCSLIQGYIYSKPSPL
jgi:diguanylate cyclase (GGDEF)-like protein